MAGVFGPKPSQRARPVRVSHTDDSELEAQAHAFEAEKTSPELRSRPRPVDEGARLFVVVATPDARRRQRFVEVLRSDGWTALEAHGADEALEMVLTVTPFVAIVDPEIRSETGQSVPELVT